MVTGSSSNPQFQGNNFARKGVIYVSFNTRESIWAYPNSAELDEPGSGRHKNKSQNFGILDVEQALDWIHDNIAGEYFLGLALRYLLTTLKPSFWRQSKPYCLWWPFLRLSTSRPLPLE